MDEEKTGEGSPGTDNDETTPGGSTEASTAPARLYPPPRRARPRKMAAKDWLEAIGMAKAGVPVRKIAKTFRVMPSTLYKGLKARGVTIGGWSPSATEVRGAAEREELLRRAKETRDNDFRITAYLQGKIAVVTKLEEDAAAAEGRAPRYSVLLDDYKALKTAIEAVKAGTDNKWRILGLDKAERDDGALPELPIRELTEDELSAMRDRQLLEDGLDEERLAELADAEAAEEIGVVEEGDDEATPGGR